jgi:hypothetical protein
MRGPATRSTGRGRSGTAGRTIRCRRRHSPLRDGGAGGAVASRAFPRVRTAPPGLVRPTGASQGRHPFQGIERSCEGHRTHTLQRKIGERCTDAEKHLGRNPAQRKDLPNVRTIPDLHGPSKRSAPRTRRVDPMNVDGCSRKALPTGSIRDQVSPGGVVNRKYFSVAASRSA